ncbi:hypothetical protein BsWGS_15698 [Bradybaena similaris]
MQPVHMLIQSIMTCSEMKDDDLFRLIKDMIFIFGGRLFFSNGLDNPLSQNMSLHFQFVHIHFLVWVVCQPSHFRAYHSVMIPTKALYAYLQLLCVAHLLNLEVSLAGGH